MERNCEINAAAKLSEHGCQLFYLVAGARSDLALGHNIALRKDKMVAGVHNHLNLLFSAIGLSERNITI